jgi:phosphoribosylformimino-5-aminoimidazole carboxamide ribotide isomerase
MSDDPVAMAQQFEAQGFGRLHLVDLDGAKAGKPQHLEVLRAVAQSTALQIDYSGGLRQTEDLEAALAAGAAQVLVGSAAVKNPAACRHWFEQFGAERLILGLDVLDGFVRISGWTEATHVTVPEVIERYADLGLHTLMCTDISKDGMLQGPSFSLYSDLCTRYKHLRIVASGGVRDRADVAQLALVGVAEIIVGKALYSGAMESQTLGEYRW